MRTGIAQLLAGSEYARCWHRVIAAAGSRRDIPVIENQVSKRGRKYFLEVHLRLDGSSVLAEQTDHRPIISQEVYVNHV